MTKSSSDDAEEKFLTDFETNQDQTDIQDSAADAMDICE